LDEQHVWQEARQLQQDAVQQEQATRRAAQDERELDLARRELNAERLSTRRVDLDEREANLDRRQAEQNARQTSQDTREAGQDTREAGQDTREAGQDTREAGQDAREVEQNERDHLRELFIGTLSHDLRNPLGTIIMGAALLMKSGNLCEGDMKTLARMARGADRMHRMIDQLLDITRIRLGTGLTLDRHHVDMNEVAKEVVDELALIHARQLITLDLASNGDGHWDRDRLAEMLSNLLGNALQHGSPSKPVSVRLRNSDGKLSIDIHNDGACIPAALLPHVFDPFRSGRRSAGGLGLGLYITKQIVAAHGGDITVQSSSDDGTTFHVELPVDT
jgi:signal transduction histidine kinase